MSSKSELKELVKEFKLKKILIVGDVMVDEYLWGTVSRISPEAPVPVVSCTSREHRMGGAANVAINVKSLGAEPIMCSVIGNDEIGVIYQQLLQKRDMSAEGLIVSAKRQTSVKTRVIGNHQHLLRVDHEITNFLDSDLELQLLNRIEEVLNVNKIDAIIFQDYDKGVLTANLIDKISVLSREKNIPSLVDPKKRSFNNYAHVSLFKPNFKELVEGLNLEICKSDHEAIFKAAMQISAEKSIESIMITMSEKGVFICNEGRYKVLPAEERDIADVSGAGDTVISVAALCLACGMDCFDAAILANRAGGLVCEKVGVVPITPDMLLADAK